MLSGDASFTQARIPRPQKRIIEYDGRSRGFIKRERTKKKTQMMMNQKMRSLMGR